MRGHMALKPGLQARQTQRLALTPQLRQGMAILQLPAVDLIAEISRLASDNPLLEFTQPTYTPPWAAGPDSTSQIAAPVSMAQNLQQQIAHMPLDPEVAEVAAFLTGDLTDDGYFDSTPDELAHSLKLPLALVEAAIAALQSCEPVGIAACDLAESLMLQLIDKGIDPGVAKAAGQNADLLAEGRWAEVRRHIDLPDHGLQNLAALMRTLSPRPAGDAHQTTQFLIPEIDVTCDRQGALTVSLHNSAIPDVRIDSELVSRLGNDPGFQSQRNNAEILIGALRFRGKTLLKVATAVVQHQHRFFIDSPDTMLPLTRVALADSIGLHPSTVGRAVAGKALSFNGATYPLSQFLGASLRHDSGVEISAFTVQQMIRRLVSCEDAGRPLSDDAIAAALTREGVDIARRTVAKYRGCLNIPSSFERRRRKAMRRARPAVPGSGGG